MKLLLLDMKTVEFSSSSTAEVVFNTGDKLALVAFTDDVTEEEEAILVLKTVLKITLVLVLFTVFEMEEVLTWLETLTVGEEVIDSKIVVKFKEDKTGVLVMTTVSKVGLIVGILDVRFLVDSTANVEDIKTDEVGVTCSILDNVNDGIRVEFGVTRTVVKEILSVIMTVEIFLSCVGRIAVAVGVGVPATTALRALCLAF